jgi:ferredoxin
MRDHIYDGIGGPFDPVPDAPDDCVVCGIPLPEIEGEVNGYNNDGCTCSQACHEKQLRREEEDHQHQKAADEAQALEYLKEKAEWGGA